MMDRMIARRGRCAHLALKLAELIEAPLTRKRPKTELALYVNKGKLSLGFAEDIPFRPYDVDFLSIKWRFRRRRGLKQNKLFLTNQMGDF